MTSNEKGFLDMIAFAELGPDILAQSADGYNVLVGSLPGRVKIFHDYSDHPRILVKINDKLSSTAAGRYQILKRTFDHYKKALNLSDFSPSSQDKIALRLISERLAYDDVRSGRIVAAIDKIKNIWASMPGSPYGQRTHKVESLLQEFARRGGIINAE